VSVGLVDGYVWFLKGRSDAGSKSIARSSHHNAFRPGVYRLGRVEAHRLCREESLGLEQSSTKRAPVLLDLIAARIGSR
jgi:hypothetical protein